MRIIEPVGIIDIADRLKVQPSAVSNWAKRYADFPEPKFRIARGRFPVYEWAKVVSWYEGRSWNRSEGRERTVPS